MDDVAHARPAWPVRHAARYTLLLAGSMSLLIFLALLSRPEPLLVLTYHRVSPDLGGPVPAVHPRDFARQIGCLARAGYRSINPDDLHAYLVKKKRLPPRAVLLTFDDGWADNYTRALPILRRYGFKAAVFVVSGRVGRPGRLSMRQLRALHREGWTIGAHTIHHVHLTALPETAAAREIRASARMLAKLTGGTVTCLAYPYGDENETVRRLAAANGLYMGFGTRVGFPRIGQDPMDIKRLSVPRRGGLILLHLATVEWFAPCRRLCAWLAESTPAVKVQEAYSRRLWRANRRSPSQWSRSLPSPRP